MTSEPVQPPVTPSRPRRNWRGWIIAGAIAVAAVIVVVVSVNNRSSGSGSTSTDPSGARRVISAQIGEKVQVEGGDEWSGFIVVHDVKHSSGNGYGSGIGDAELGSWVAADVEFASVKGTLMPNAGWFAVVSSEGRQFTSEALNPPAYRPDLPFLEKVGPGRSIRGWIVFDVPKDGSYQLHMDGLADFTWPVPAFAA